MLELSRLEMLIGKEGIEKLKNSSVIIFGIGGVGSYAAEALARAGVGKMTLVDYDDVCVTNTNRQIHALKENIGLFKTEAMKKRIDGMNIGTEVTVINEIYNEENHERIFAGNYDFVVDAIDMVTSKLMLAEYCSKNGINLIAAMGTGNKFHPEMLEITDINKTIVCPLARVMRKELKERGIKKLTVVYSKENPVKPDKGSHNCKTNCVCPPNGAPINCTTRRGIPGSTSFVPPAAGMIIASYVVRKLLEIE